MTDERYAYFTDQAAKSVTARSANAKYKRQNTFNNYTSAEAAKLSGECKTYNLGKPMKYTEFKAMPEEHQKTYLQMLTDKGVSKAAIAEMLGVSISTVKIQTKKHNIVLHNTKGTFESSGARTWFEEFCKASTAEPKAEMEEFISFEQFKALSKDFQEQYLDGLIRKYRVGLQTISSTLFGTYASGLNYYISSHGLVLSEKGVFGGDSHKYKEAFASAVATYREGKVEEPIKEKPAQESKDIPKPVLRRLSFDMVGYDAELVRTFVKTFGDRKVKIMVSIEEMEE